MVGLMAGGAAGHSRQAHSLAEPGIAGVVARQRQPVSDRYNIPTPWRAPGASQIWTITSIRLPSGLPAHACAARKRHIT